MNIDIKALEAIEADKGIGVDDLLTTIAEALLHAYYAHRGEVEDAPRARVDIDAQTGTVNVMITQVDDDGNVINEFDDTPNNFGRIGAHAVRDAIVRRLREAETSRAFDAYSDFEGRVISGIVQADARAKERGIIVVHLGTEADGQDGIILPAEQIPGEKLNHGDRVKCYRSCRRCGGNCQHRPGGGTPLQGGRAPHGERTQRQRCLHWSAWPACLQHYA